MPTTDPHQTSARIERSPTEGESARLRALTAVEALYAAVRGKFGEPMTSGKKQTLEIQTQARHWGLISRATKESGLHLKDMTTNLLKWSSITSLIPSAIGIGGLFGVERLAQTATERLRGTR